ncbi:MAG: glycosyltransferase family 9 protein [Candidatus Omnitrophota bacterium]
MDSPRRILIINPFGIGDVLFTTPVIESIRKGSPDCEIGYLCSRRAEPVLRANPNIERVFVYEKDELRGILKRSVIEYARKLISFVMEIRRSRFDTAIDLSFNREYGLICVLAGIGRRIGFNYRNRGAYLTEKIDIEGYGGKHIIEYYLGLLEMAGIRPSSKEITLYIPEADKEWARKFLQMNNAGKDGLLAGIAPAGGASWGKDAGIKHWSSDGYALVADRLADELKAKVIIFGSADEAPVCESIRAAMRNKPIEAYGKTSLLQAAALMGMCRVVIANDGGLLHLAAGAGAGTVGIFGPVDEKVYGQYPYGSGRHRAVKEDVPCRPCYRNFKMKDCNDRVCLSRIGADEVYNAAKEVLSAR